MSKGTIPVFNLNVPGGGPQQPIVIPSNAPVYSSYTGNQVGTGAIPKGTISDAPQGNPNYGKPFHVVEYNPANKTYMMHRSKGNK